VSGFGDGPLDHLLRVMPPWYTGPPLTECGRPTADVAALTDRAALKAKFARLGNQRASFSSCMTCVNLSGRVEVWERRPDAVVERWVRGSAFRGAGVDGATPAADLMRHELLALGLLVEAHREEFAGLVEALGQTEDLDAARRRARIRSLGPSA
jgi:hypothetical protein